MLDKNSQQGKQTCKCDCCSKYIYCSKYILKSLTENAYLKLYSYPFEFNVLLKVVFL